MDLSFLQVKNDHILQGSQHYINECYTSAVQSFTQALNDNKKNSAANLYRANAYIALGDYKNALVDLDEVERSQEKLFEVYYKKGIAFFNLPDYGSSHEYLLKAIAVSQSPEQRENVDRWMSKLKTELPKEVLNKIQGSTNTSQLTTFKQTWDQDAQWIFLNLESSEKLESDNIVINIEKRNIAIIHKSTPVYSLVLCNSIIPNLSTKEIKADSIVLKLKKEINDFNWINVDKAKENESIGSFQQSYPSSSKKKKDWTDVEKEINKQLNAEPDEEGINSLFKQIYSRGDEETRRAMIKSFQTSGGTVLSTNWGEVKEKDYEGKDRPEPPKDQEWKKPEI